MENFQSNSKMKMKMTLSIKDFPEKMREKKPHNPKENKFWMNEKMGFQYFYFSIETKKKTHNLIFWM
jgi:hypothetical protein